jgi:hypothetical protein
MNGSITAKQQDNIYLIAAGRHTYLPFNCGVCLERPQIFRRASQPEDSGGPHVRDESSRNVRPRGNIPTLDAY